MLRLIAAVLCLACAAPALAQERDLTGWWRAQLEAPGGSADFFVRLHEVDGRAAVQASMPAVRIDRLPLGPYQVEGDTLRLPGLQWSLDIAADGESFAAMMPAGLVRHHQIEARFVRSEAPPEQTELIGAETAPEPAWSVDLGAEIWAGLTYDPRRRRLYVGAVNGRLVALDARTGAERWSVDLGAGVHAAPLLDGNRLYVTTDAALHALNAGNGRIVWSHAFGAERSARLPHSNPQSRWDHYGAGAVRDGELVLTASRDGCVYALAVRDGRERWRQCVEDIVTTTPAVAEGRVFFGGFDRHVYALSREDGEVLWRRDTLGAVTHAPVAVDGGGVLVGSRSHDLAMLDAATGEERWRRLFWLSWVDSTPAVRDGVAYIGSSDLLAVQAITLEGAQIWTSPVPGWSWATPAVGESSVYAAVAGAREYMTPRAGALAAFDRASGALRWLIRAERPEGADFYGFAASPAVAGRRLFAADLTGRVTAFDDAPR